MIKSYEVYLYLLGKKIGVDRVKNKREIIEILIEECYKNFPELMKEIPEEEMYEILDKNILNIRSGREDKKVSGLYYTDDRSIEILNKGKVKLEDIKKDPEILAVLAHEGIHALFRKSKRDTRNRER